MTGRHALLLVAVFLFAAASSSLARETVAVGDEAPDFELNDSSGKSFKLSDFRGKNNVVIEFIRSGSW